MDYLTAKELSEKWGISQRRIVKLCKEGRIPGVLKMGQMYLIPKGAVKPEDKRFKKNRNGDQDG